MKGYGICLLFLAVAVISCNDCNNCEPFTEEPNVLVRFYNLPDTLGADTTRRIIIIDSVNQVATGALRHFSDTTYSFKFPLDMNKDLSEFNLVFRDTSNLDSLVYNQVSFSYTREFLRRDDNYIVLQCSLAELQSDFLTEELICKDSTSTICISNDAKANIYN